MNSMSLQEEMLDEQRQLTYVEQIKDLDWKYKKLEKKYHKLQMKYQDRLWIIKKLNRRITNLEGNKQHYNNEPKSVRQAKGKIR